MAGYIRLNHQPSLMKKVLLSICLALPGALLAQKKQDYVTLKPGTALKILDSVQDDSRLVDMCYTVVVPNYNPQWFTTNHPAEVQIARFLLKMIKEELKRDSVIVVIEERTILAFMVQKNKS